MTAYPDQFPPAQPGTVSSVVRVRGGTTVLELSGEWDLAGAPPVERVVTRILAGNPGSVALDLSKLSFMDSSGLRATVRLAKRCAAQGTQLAIVPGPPAVQRLFQICGFLPRLPFTDPPASGRPPLQLVPSRPEG